MVLQPTDAHSLLLPRLSLDALHRLERNAQEPVATSKAARVRNWLYNISMNTTAISSSVIDISLHHEVPHVPPNVPSQKPAENIQCIKRSSTSAGGLVKSRNTDMDRFVHPNTISYPPVLGRREQAVERHGGDDHLLSNHIPRQSQLSTNETRCEHAHWSNPPRKNISSGIPPYRASISVDMNSIKPIVPEVMIVKHSPQIPPSACITVERIINNQKREDDEKTFKKRIQDVLPDICEEYLQTLYANHRGKMVTSTVQEALDAILVQPSYPKKAQKKRKQMEETVENDDLTRIRSERVFYLPIVLKLLQKQFASVPQITVQALLKRHKTFFQTYLALHQLHRPSTDADEYWRRLDNVKDQHPPLFAKVIEYEWRQAKKCIADREAAKRKRQEEKEEIIIEEEHRVAGALIECQCCFTEVPPNRMVPCEGDRLVHFFCNSCIRKGVETQVGLMQYQLKCFATSGCEAAFDSIMVKQVVGDKLMKRVEDLQQIDEIAKASIDGLEECPFCEFKAICPPIEQHKEFKCMNPECEETSCRLCREETHIPQSCKEARRTRGISERRVVEEAMTATLIRNCPKCKLSIVKNDGCNKLTCVCGTFICDVCKKDISAVGYKHFEAGGGRCPIWENDKGHKRQMDEVIRAERAAIESILAKDRNIDPKLLRITTNAQSAKGKVSFKSA